jgi:post-segregation antitoxin (ccd killing protein)
MRKASTKQNVTVAVDKQLLKRARALAASRGASISSLLADGLRRLDEQASAYERAKAKAFALLNSGLHLGGAGIEDRDALHDRQALR